jgi:hypothetical protein
MKLRSGSIGEMEGVLGTERPGDKLSSRLISGVEGRVECLEPEEAPKRLLSSLQELPWLIAAFFCFRVTTHVE